MKRSNRGNNLKASSGLRVESTRNSGHHVVEAEMQVCGTQLDGKLFCAKDMTRRPMANSFTKLLFCQDLSSDENSFDGSVTVCPAWSY